MNTAIFSSVFDIISGLIVGFLFGFFLRKAYVTRFPVIVGQLLLKDFTVMKVIMTAIGFGSLFIYSLLYFFPEKELIYNSTTILAALIGGAIFGLGMVVMGFCPGTGIGALADGARDMWFGLLGMIAGAAIYAEVSPWLEKSIRLSENIYLDTLSDYFSISPWYFIAFFFVVIGTFLAVDRRTQRPPSH